MQDDIEYDQCKAFFEATNGRYFLPRPLNFNEHMIHKAFENDDKETVIAAYLNILLHEKEILKPEETYQKVLDSMDTENFEDNVLYYDLQKRKDEAYAPEKSFEPSDVIEKAPKRHSIYNPRPTQH